MPMLSLVLSFETSVEVEWELQSADVRRDR
jgi:hypothetical protein